MKVRFIRMETLPCNSFTPTTVGVSLSLTMFASVIYILRGTYLGAMYCGSTLSSALTVIGYDLF